MSKSGRGNKVVVDPSGEIVGARVASVKLRFRWQGVKGELRRVEKLQNLPLASLRLSPSYNSLVITSITVIASLGNLPSSSLDSHPTHS